MSFPEISKKLRAATEAATRCVYKIRWFLFLTKKRASGTGVLL